MEVTKMSMLVVCISFCFFLQNILCYDTELEERKKKKPLNPSLYALNLLWVRELKFKSIWAFGLDLLGL